MRIISCQLENFVSYKTLDFEFDSRGLCLIQGPTGAGKSTLCDVIPWVLFGVTAKNGAVDEVLNWYSKDSTEGRVGLQKGQSRWVIVRIRGKANDLFYEASDGQGPIRGKDLQDTQKKINNLLGFDSSTYLAASYYHEFSPTAQFFTATAKQRRQLCENLVDLSLVKKVSENLAALTKQVNAEALAAKFKYNSLFERGQSIHDDITKLEAEQKRLEIQNQAADKEEIECLATDMEVLDAAIGTCTFQLNELHSAIGPLKVAIAAIQDELCDKCFQPVKSVERSDLQSELNEVNLRIREITKENQLNQTLLAKAETELIQLSTKKVDSPYKDLIGAKTHALNTVEKMMEELEVTTADINKKQGDCTILENLIVEARKILITQAIGGIEYRTNELLTDFFDAEIQVKFDVEAADKLEVMITKDGNICSFTQLSKGQRQLLKLCFGVSVMKQLQNYKESRFSLAFFDESLHGLDSDMKKKAFNLFSSLQGEYESIFVVEHDNDLKPLFLSQITIEAINGQSEICHD